MIASLSRNDDESERKNNDDNEDRSFGMMNARRIGALDRRGGRRKAEKARIDGVVDKSNMF